MNDAVHYERHGLTAQQVGYACPEQYEVRVDGKMNGYLRLRHGIFTVECPDVGGENVYTSHPKGDGSFDDDEREFFVHAALDAIAKWIETGGNNERSSRAT